MPPAKWLSENRGAVSPEEWLLSWRHQMPSIVSLRQSWRRNSRQRRHSITRGGNIGGNSVAFQTEGINLITSWRGANTRLQTETDPSGKWLALKSFSFERDLAFQESHYSYIHDHLFNSGVVVERNLFYLKNVLGHRDSDLLSCL
jgi:hypothetical protein